MSDVEIAVVVSPREWAEKLHRFVADHGGARVRARILDAREALADDYLVLIVDDLTSFLSPRVVGELEDRGRLVVGVYDPDEPWGRERLLETGITETIPQTLEPEEIVRRLRELTRDGRPDGDRTARIADPVETTSSGQIVVLTGPPGGVGITEISCGLASSLRSAGRSVVVVDADVSTPSLAQRLDLPFYPNLRTAIDAVEHRACPLEDAILVAPSADWGVLAGLSTGGMWSEIRADEVGAVLRSLARLGQHVVVDAGSRLEELPTTVGFGRFDVPRTAVAMADVVVAVCAPTPVGVTRLFSTLSQVGEIASCPVLAVVNRAPASRFRRTEIELEIARTAPVLGIGFVPEDRRVADAAWEGATVPRSRYTRAVDALARSAVSLTEREVVRT